MNKFLLTISIACMSYTLAAQSMVDGFMRGKGNLNTAGSYSYESYDSYYIGDSIVTNPNLGTISTKSVGLYLAGGITDYLDVIVSLPYVSVAPSQGYWSSQRGFQDLSIFAKIRALKKEIGSLGELSVMASGGLSFPVSDYIANSPVAIGHHSTNLDGRLIVQHRLPFGVFIMAQGGYIKKYNIKLDTEVEVSVPDAWDYVVKVGGTYKILYADAWINFREARSGTNIGQGVPFPTNAISYTRTGFNLYCSIPWIKSLGASFGTSFTLSGENIGKATRFSGALIYNVPFFKDSENKDSQQ